MMIVLAMVGMIKMNLKAKIKKKKIKKKINNLQKRKNFKEGIHN